MSDPTDLDNSSGMVSSLTQVEAGSALAALKSIRVARGLSLEDVSARLKFAPRQIEAFENGQWDQLPAGIGLRTLAKNYSRLLGVDTAALEPLLPRQEVRGGATIARQHASSANFGTTTVDQPEKHRSWPWLLIILVVVLVVLVIAVWQGILPKTILPGWLTGLFN